MDSSMLATFAAGFSLGQLFCLVWFYFLIMRSR
nr:MAG TPA: Lysosome-associated membrane glycoprotein 2 PROTEIN [Caudoviricetes sp.]